jgi:hypothetical protein
MKFKSCTLSSGIHAVNICSVDTIIYYIFYLTILPAFIIESVVLFQPRTVDHHLLYVPFTPQKKHGITDRVNDVSRIGIIDS